MGVDHCRLNAPVTQQLLHGQDVIAVQEQVSGEGMPLGLTARRLGNARQRDEMIAAGIVS
jgi:hypothetical protein